MQEAAKKVDKLKTIFNHLNGLRGLLALCVLIQHSTEVLKLSGDYQIFKRLGN